MYYKNTIVLYKDKQPMRNTCECCGAKFIGHRHCLLLCHEIEIDLYAGWLVHGWHNYSIKNIDLDCMIDIDVCEECAKLTGLSVYDGDDVPQDILYDVIVGRKSKKEVSEYEIHHTSKAGGIKLNKGIAIRYEYDGYVHGMSHCEQCGDNLVKPYWYELWLSFPMPSSMYANFLNHAWKYSELGVSTIGGTKKLFTIAVCKTCVDLISVPIYKSDAIDGHRLTTDKIIHALDNLEEIKGWLVHE